MTALTAGMLNLGLGIGCAFVAGSVSSLAGVPSEDSRVAPGVQRIPVSLGATMGVALVSTVSVSTTAHLGVGPSRPQSGPSGSRPACAGGTALATAACIAARPIASAARRDLLGSGKVAPPSLAQADRHQREVGIRGPSLSGGSQKNHSPSPSAFFLRGSTR